MDDASSAAFKIKAYSDALNVLLMEDVKEMMQEEFSSLTNKQSLLLEFIKDQGRTVTEIAEHFATTPSAASQLINKLEKSGFLKREINLKNRREIIVSMGTKGKQYHEMISEMELHIIRKYYLRLEKRDLEQLLDLYEKLYQIALEAKQKS